MASALVMILWRFLSVVLGVVDQVVGVLLPRAAGKFWADGFGDVERMYRVAAMERKVGLEGAQDIAQVRFGGTTRTKEGHSVRMMSFTSPIAKELPKETREVHVQVVEPKEPRTRPVVVIHLQATGDEGFSQRRTRVAIPLAESGITSMLLQIPFYGARRAKDQRKHFTRTVENFMMCAHGSYTEAAKLAHWVKAEYQPNASIVFTGFSFGGCMATYAASMLVGEPCAVVSCCGPSSPHVVLTGVLRGGNDWRKLTEESGGDQEKAELRVVRVFDEIADMAGQIEDAKKREQSKNGAAYKHHVCVSIAARDDSFVSMSSMKRMHEVQRAMDPSAELSVVAGGHGSTFLRSKTVYVPRILDAIDELHRRIDASVPAMNA